MVARGAKTITIDDVTVDPFAGVIDNFKTSIGAFGTGSIKVNKRNARTGKYEYISRTPVSETTIEEFTDQLRDDYPEGGEFYLNLIDTAGKARGNASVTLGPLPPSLRGVVKEKEESPFAGDGMFMMMMNMQQRQAESAAQASRDQMALMMTLQSQQQQAQTALLTAILPAMMGNKGESPAQMMAAISAVYKDMKPASDDSMAKTLGMVKDIKEIFGPNNEGGDSEGGLLGSLAKMAGPVLGMMAAGAKDQVQQGQTPGAQPQPPAQRAYVQSPQIAAPVVAPTAPETLDVMQALIQKYTPIMTGIKKLLEKGGDADKVLDYVDIMQDTDEISQDDVQQLFSGIEQQPEQLAPVLSVFGITEPEHVAIIAEAINIAMAPSDDSDGQDGGATDTIANGDDGQDGESNPGSEVESVKLDAEPGVKG